MLAALSVVALAMAGVMFTVAPTTDEDVASAKQEPAKVEYVAQKADTEQPRL
jgi:type II secretory pathway pseudopilin PulG